MFKYLRLICYTINLLYKLNMLTLFFNFITNKSINSIKLAKKYKVKIIIHIIIYYT